MINYLNVYNQHVYYRDDFTQLGKVQCSHNRILYLYGCIIDDYLILYIGRSKNSNSVYGIIFARVKIPEGLLPCTRIRNLINMTVNSTMGLLFASKQRKTKRRYMRKLLKQSNIKQTIKCTLLIKCCEDWALDPVKLFSHIHTTKTIRKGVTNRILKRNKLS